jgi:hypothetical protein
MLRPAACCVFGVSASFVRLRKDVIKVKVDVEVKLHSTGPAFALPLPLLETP